MTNAPIVLVDGSSYLYRAFFALPPLATKSGQPTGAIKGVVNMLRRLQENYPNSQLAVVFDAKGPTFRDEIYAEYKANRPPMPDDLRSQIELLHQVIHAQGLPLISVEGVEADDVLGTLAVQAAAQDKKVVISTGDKDMAQLVNKHVSLVNTMDDSFLDVEGVKEKFGLPPELIIDFLALMGDKSDNIPGVPGVGEKTALALLQGLGSINDIYANLDKIAELKFRGSKTLAPKLKEHEEVARLSYQLATIKLDCELPLALEEIQQQPINVEELTQLYTQLEFNTELKQLNEQLENASGSNEPQAEQKEEVEVNYTTILTEEDFNTWLEKLSQAEYFALDTETTSLNYMQAQLVGISFAITPKEAAYLPFSHDYLGAPTQLNKKACLAKLKPILENPAIGKVGQNLKYDLSILAKEDIHLAGIKADTMLQSYVLDAASNRHDLASLALTYLGKQMLSYEELAGKGKKQLTFNQIDLETAAFYAAEDADITLQVYLALAKKLATEPQLEKVLAELDLPIAQLLAKIERQGVKIDVGLLNRQNQELSEQLQQLEADAYKIADQEFNLNSPKQLGEILFEQLKIPVIKKTPKGAPSTAEAVLEELALDYPLPKIILQYRSLAKLRNTYTDKLPQLVETASRRVHTNYHQAVTSTGRLSSSNPNLQNIPVRTEEGRRIRQAFIAEEGYKLVAADYSQIELRIMAHLAQDEGMLAAFKQGLDIHRATAAEVFSTPLEEVTATQRYNAKAINFGLIYGMSAFGLAKQLNLENTQAQVYIDSYFARYPAVKNYMSDTKTKAAKQGYVETLYGRRLYLAQINARNYQQRQAAERLAINAPVQGTAADIMKAAMLAVDTWLTKSKLDARILMQVHDELVLEVKEDQVEELLAGLVPTMEQAAELSLPLVVEAASGNNWNEAH